MYAIAGATGKTGSVITNTLLKHKQSVRVFGRDPGKLQNYAARGAEIVTGDLENAADLKRFFEGATAAYLLVPPNGAVDDFRAFQSRVVAATAEALSGSSVKHAVSLSSIGGELSSGNGPIAGLHELEEALNAIPELNLLHLRAVYFYENFLFSIELIRGMGINGGPTAPDMLFPMVAAQDVGAYAAERLLKLDFSGRNVHYIMGPRELTFAQATAILGKAIGRDDLPYVQFPGDQAEQGMIAAGLKPQLASLYVEMSEAINEQRLRVDQRYPVIQTHTALEDYAKDFARVYKL